MSNRESQGRALGRTRKRFIERGREEESGRKEHGVFEFNIVADAATTPLFSCSSIRFFA